MRNGERACQLIYQLAAFYAIRLRLWDHGPRTVPPSVRLSMATELGGQAENE